MSLDSWNQVAGVVSGVLALVGGVAAVRRHQRGRAERGWWTALRPLWQHQHAERMLHPHRFGRGPVRPLAQVYVPRRAVPRLDPAGGEVDVARLLTGTGHVLLLGELGSGKSALVRQACTDSARRWLAGRGRLRRTGAGPVVLSLPAAALVDQALPAALRAAYREVCPGLDVTRPPARGRVWLVCVDGVDAVTDPDDRGRVLNRLADAARTGGPETTGPRPWRVLVTTRQLAGTELAVLRDYQAHHLVPFTDADVALLASRWFPTGGTAAAFLRWLRDQRIDEPVRNPLTATIAALVWDNEWAGSIPGTGPAALLEGFVAALLAGGRATLEAVAGRLRATPGGEPLAAWLTTHQPELVEVAAIAARDGHDPVDAAVAWSARHAPGPPAGIEPDWAGQVRAVLLATGLFREPRADERSGSGDPAALLPAGAGLLDYLAAGPLADDWREDRWIAAMTTTGDRGLGLYALTRVATAPDFLQRMAAQGPAGAVSAGYALAAGQPVADAVRAEVLAALLTHWSAHPTTTDPGTDPDADPARECLSLLITLAAVRSTRELLRRIGTDPQRPRVVREAAALFFAVRQQTAGRVRPGADVAG
ncbi:hypothetical protein ACFO0M_28035 [Micromonospora mangrovi]|uniref:NACHT domain-containing protein n=2 Tax=Micromonospora TaxID=1873 RepID=A0AAU8HMK8_9ACTN